MPDQPTKDDFAEALRFYQDKDTIPFLMTILAALRLAAAAQPGKEDAERARDVVTQVIGDFGQSRTYTSTALFSDILAKAIASALAAAEARGREAEREACVLIALDEDGHFTVWGEHRNTVVAQTTGRDIAAAIRSRTPQEGREIAKEAGSP